MDNKKIGQAIRKKTGAEGVKMESKSVDPGEVWISPRHWKAMSDNNKAIVVDLWHNHRGYSDRFPFGYMLRPNNDYDVGITFSIGDDNIKDQALLLLIKEFKIPHLLGTYEEIRKGKDKQAPKAVA